MDEFVRRLIERLQAEQSEAECLWDDSEYYTGQANAFESAMYIAKDLAEEHGIGWIPCIERYPDTDGYILLSFSNFSVPCVGRYEEDDDGGAFYIGDEDVSCVSQDMFVNAWRPLPEPYREE